MKNSQIATNEDYLRANEFLTDMNGGKIMDDPQYRHFLNCVMFSYENNAAIKTEHFDALGWLIHQRDAEGSI